MESGKTKGRFNEIVKQAEEKGGLPNSQTANSGPFQKVFSGSHLSPLNMSKREEKYQRTLDALTESDMRKMWIFVWCFFFPYFL